MQNFKVNFILNRDFFKRISFLNLSYTMLYNVNASKFLIETIIF